jgi:hypothetical protein
MKYSNCYDHRAGRARVSVVDWGTTSRKVADSIPDEIVGFFNWPNPSSRIMALSSTQSLTEMSIRNLPGDKEQPEREPNNLTPVCEPIV